MSELDFFGHWFYFFIAVGMWFLHAKDKRGWLIRLAGELGWVGLGLAMGMSSIVFWGLVFMYIDLKGYSTWLEEEKCLELAEARQVGIRYGKFGMPYDIYDFAVNIEAARLDRLGKD
jgi:hypothetical protein